MTTPSDPVATLDALLDELAGEARAATHQADEDPASVSAPPQDAEEIRPVYSNLNDWVVKYFSRVIERKLAAGAQPGAYWCRRWWAHPEAIARLYALWRTWETLRLNAQTGMSVWWRDHLDHHFSMLTAQQGPFGRCLGSQGHIDPTPIPVDPAPPEVLAQLPDDMDADGADGDLDIEGDN